MRTRPGSPSAADPDPAEVPVLPVAAAADRIVVDGTETAFWTYGPPDARLTAVAVHGFRGDHHGLLPVVAELRGVRVVVPDLPGFGASAPFADEHSVSRYARWLTDFGTAVGGSDPIVLVGHSFGSVVSAAAVAGGLAVDRLVLINPIGAPALEGPRAVLSRLALGYYRAGAALPGPIGSALLASPLVVQLMSEITAKTSDRELRAWIHDQHHRYFSSYADRRVVLEAFRASVSAHVGDYADGIAVPTLLIAGDSDDITPVQAQQRLRGRLTDGRLRVLAGVGHLIHYERPRLAAELINEFVGSQRTE